MFKDLFKDFFKKNSARTHGIIWLIKVWTLYYLFLYVALIFAVPAAYAISYGITDDFLIMYKRYLHEILTTGGFYLFRYYFYIWWPQFIAAPKLELFAIFIPLMTYPVVKFFIKEKNPYKLTDLAYGEGRLATVDDVFAMRNIKDGFIFVLGKIKGKFIKMNETLSIMCFAPPGTGKTEGVVIPTLFENDKISMIVNDIKPELCYKTSGYRASIGISFTVNWGKTDEPEKGIYYPSWNPLAPDSIPPLGPERDMYIESMTNVMIQSGRHSDSYWEIAGRNALTGFIHLIVSKAERARANDYFFNKLKDKTFNTNDAKLLASYYMTMQDNLASGAIILLKEGKLNSSNYVPVGTWENIPNDWISKEACFPMMLDLITYLQIKTADNINKRKEMGDYSAGNADPMKDLLQGLVKESQRFGYSRRAVQELTKLGNTGDKERASVISTFLTEINIFNNEAVRQRTSRNDIKFRYLRGMMDPRDGQWKPVTIYLSVNQVDAAALGKISGMFIDLMSRYLISNKPDTLNVRDGQLGPYPTMFILDEFPQMPKLDAVINGPAVGRGQKVSYLLIGQDINQITKRYGTEETETMFSNTAAKIILRQNNDKAAKRLSEFIGTKTSIKTTYEKGWDDVIENKDKDGKKNIEKKKTLEEVKIIDWEDMMTLKFGKQYVLMQGEMNLPIEADTPFAYEDKDLVSKYWNPDKQEGAYPPASPLPEFMIKK